MKKLIVAAALATAAIAGPAMAGIGISLDIGAPGFYGQLDIGGYHPRTLYDRPVIVQQGYAAQPPVYLRVPVGQDRNWRFYCGRYNACDRPVYFVRDDWYRNDYAPRYRNDHWRDGRYDRRDDRWNDHRDDRRDNRWDNRRDYGNDRRDDHYDRGQDRGNDHRNDGHGQDNNRGQSNNHGQNDGHSQNSGRPNDGRNDHNGRHDDNDGHR